MMRRFAQDTTVSVEKSKSEIESMLGRNGATSYMSGTNQTEAIFAFEMSGRKIMFRLPLPNKLDRKFTHTESQKKLRHTNDIQKAWEQSCRSRFRALNLAIKAKLEAVAIGITTLEEEFLAHIVMADGLTVAQHTLPRIAEAYEKGTITPLLGGKNEQ
jgi:hypothetical protein